MKVNSRMDVKKEKENVIIPKVDRTEKVRRLWYKFSMNKLSVVGLLIVVSVIIISLCRQWIAPYPEHAGAFVDFSNVSKPPSLEHLMGTDTLGRDVFSRVIYAFKGALTMGIGVLIVVVPIGGILGNTVEFKH